MGVVKIQGLPYQVMGSCFCAHKTVIADTLAPHVIIREHSEKQAVLLPPRCLPVRRFSSPASSYSVNITDC